MFKRLFFAAIRPAVLTAAVKSTLVAALCYKQIIMRFEEKCMCYFRFILLRAASEYTAVPPAAEDPAQLQASRTKVPRLHS